MPAEMLINQIPVLSTAHLPEDVAQALFAGTYSLGLLTAVAPAAPRDLLFVYVGGEILQSSSLAPAHNWARENGYSWIRFDSIGDVVEGLPIYDW